MAPRGRMPFAVAVAGLAAMVVGCLDPLEGSVLIVAGAVLEAVAGRFGASRHTRQAVLALVLVAIGVAAMFALSAVGGVGGRTGRSAGWALVILPYPVGAILALVVAVRLVRELRRVPRQES